MTTQDQDAITGRLLRERQELNRKATALQAESKRIGERLIELGKAAIRCHVALEHEEVEREVGSWGNPLYRVTAADLEEINKVVPLAREYRATVEGLRERSQQLKVMGVEIS